MTALTPSLVDEAGVDPRYAAHVIAAADRFTIME
jgi:hypothetical protein